MFVFLLVVTMFSFVIWFIDSREPQVVSIQPIGGVISMSRPSGFWDRMVIETELGFFPLIDVAVISKGTPHVLEQRRSDDRFVCDVPHTLCIKTLGQEFKSPVKTPIGLAIARSALPSQCARP